MNDMENDKNREAEKPESEKKERHESVRRKQNHRLNYFKKR